MTWLALMAAVLLQAPAQADAPPPVVGGAVTDDWDAVGLLLACDEQTCQLECSATLISSQWAVTAAHCVTEMEEALSEGGTAYFAIGANIQQISDYDAIVDWAAHPDFSIGIDIENDIGLVKMQHGIDSVSPMALSESEVSEPWIGKSLTFIGFGSSGASASDSGTKRTAEIPLDDFDEDVVYAIDPAGEQSLCSGDSGGAAVRQTNDGMELVAVNAFLFGGASDDMCEGSGTGATRIDTHMDFLSTYVSFETTLDSEAATTEGQSESLTGADLDHDNSQTHASSCATVRGGTSGLVALLSLFGLAIRRR